MSKAHTKFMATLEEVVSLSAGGTPSRSVKSNFGGPIPWVKSGEVKSPCIQSTEESLTKEGLDSSAAKLFPRQTTLVALYGATAGQVGRLGIEAATNQAVLGIRAHDEADSGYLFHALSFAVPRLLRYVQGGAQPNLNGGMVRKLMIFWPSRTLKDLITSLCGRANQQITDTESLIAAKREQKRGLMQELLTGRRRFPGFEKSNTLEECLCYGRRPKDWSLCRLGDLCRGVTRKNRDNGCDQVLTVSGSRGMIDQREYFSKIIAGDNRDGYYLLNRGEFAYNRSRMKGYRYGAIKRLDRYDAGILSTLNICFGSESDAVRSDYLVHLFEAQILDRQLRRITQEGARSHGLLNVTKTDFMNVKILIPSLEEQDHIVHCLSSLDAEISHLESLAHQLREQKRGLMQRLFSGDLDLSKLTAAAEEVSA